MPVLHDELPHSGRLPVNTAGQPRSAWPTFVSFPQSRAFKPGQPGAIQLPDGGWDEPTATEREIAMGYIKGDTRAPGLTNRHRCGMLGRCIDMNTLQSLLAIAAAWHGPLFRPPGQPALLAATCISEPPTSVGPSQPAAADSLEPSLERYLVNLAVAAAAQVEDSGMPDIWDDSDALHFFQHH